MASRRGRAGGVGRGGFCREGGRNSEGGMEWAEEELIAPGTVRYLRTPWDTNCLVVDGFIYNCHSVKANGTKYWRCHNYSKKKGERCKTRCVTKMDEVQSMTSEHNHLPHKDKILKYKQASERKSTEMIKNQKRAEEVKVKREMGV